MPTSSTVGKRPAKVRETTSGPPVPGCRRGDFSGLTVTLSGPKHLGRPQSPDRD
ncbi:hypothetical protein C791_8326 [Amycolatopsis azurea DSM 43854]|uniref:Uncharacterized protein n=1 Tax=Amycolatopsis azurea DSM 43854 TaxID=1238180 RepID=M2Q957_9PSEU|nr:hypothetical protein C791_8326 [Amycolatopsis azurea DSM 43854]